MSARLLGASGDRWIEPFLEANRAQLTRLGILAAVETRSGIGLRLTPGTRIGAVPLLSPSTRRVAAGLLVSPRFRWSALGAVLGDIGFSAEPSLGGSPLVPGSAREVPPWLLAAPVVRRLEGLLAHRKRGFVEQAEERESPRGRVDWARWATRAVPSGKWTRLPCHFSEPSDDPELLAWVRWTLARLAEELAPFGEPGAPRVLRKRVGDLQAVVGPGSKRRPLRWMAPTESAWVAEALQAMGWIAEERGLGGDRSLDGMSWDLAVEEVWEAWVDCFVAQLAPRCGLVALRRGSTWRRINWRTPVGSMRSLVPDCGLRGPGRIVWVDAKYKAHLQRLAHAGWDGLGPNIRDAHRADLHQALAYASIDEGDRVDSILAYPDLSSSRGVQPAVATIGSGRRRVRLLLMALPFGFRSADQRDETLGRWRDALA
ncbi:MAG TPA: hypothetical protein VNB06_02090 [Thermoanaerobaculia bacterium]|nr:hypothetical protein [Thermoanaerobaculia bacterium]